MIKKFLLYSTLFITTNVFAQQQLPTNQQQNNETKIENQKDIDFTKEEIALMNDSLEKLQYQKFFEVLRSSKAVKNNYIKYLSSKANDGHIPIYWLMAEHYAKEKNALETHKWYYIALIMTQQDSYLCTDRTARNAPRTLMKAFPLSLDVTRQTPQYIEQSMREVIYFITNLKNRASPEWVCHYGEEGVPPGNSITIQKQFWNNERAQVLKRFTDKFAK